MLLIGNDIGRDRDVRVSAHYDDLLVQGGMEMLLVSAPHFVRGLDESVERGGVQRLGIFLSRPIVHGPTSAGSGSPSLVISTAQPSSSSFLITRADQPSSRQCRGSCGVLAAGAAMSVMFE